MPNKYPSTRTILKKLAMGSDDADTIARAIERQIRADRSQEEVLEDLVQCFMAIRDLKKQGTTAPMFSPSRLIGAFCTVGKQKGISPERLCTLLLERVLLEPAANDGTPTQPKANARSRVLDAAFEVFTEKGFHVATVDEIAERAGVGKGTFYRYFSNKEALFNELVHLRLQELERDAQAVLDSQDEVLTMIAKYLRIYFEFFDRNQRLYRLIVQEHLDVGNQMQDLYVKKIMRRIPALIRKIHEASQHGVLKDVDFQTVFYGTMGFIHGVIQKWLAHECSYSLVEELATVEEVLFFGFCKQHHPTV